MTDTDLSTAGNGADDTENSELSSGATPDVPAPATAEAPSSNSLANMVLPELRALANRVGVKGTSGMRKNELIAAIREREGQSNGVAQNGGTAAVDTTDNDTEATERATESATESPIEPPIEAKAIEDKAIESTEATVDGGSPATDAATGQEGQRRERRGASRDLGASGTDRSDQARQDRDKGEAPANKTEQDTKSDGKSDTKSDTKPDASGDQQQSGSDQQGGQQSRDDDGEGRQGRRGRRFRDRRRRGDRGGEGNGEAELREDDVVQPVAGILDVLDNYAFVRTSGYLAGPNDVYVSMNMVRKNGLRRGDHITGAVRVPREGEQPNQRQKFNPLVRLDSVNGGPVEDAKKRPDFGKLTPLYPNQRLRLETNTEKLTTRVIDLIMPIGKGQRALIVSPPKAGKTTILQDIANAITRNNPECHLMVVLVDERPEEVTDMQRSVKGEVIASTFDRPPSDHTSVAELGIERAKRLVEQGKDVVVLLDSITRLGRAYNNASPASGRILSGGVDSTALYPPKRFLGAARNIEEGGSLTIIATAMVETGSTGDTVIFEEFKGTGNAELKLDRKISERRVFPAVDVAPSGTRKDELLLSPDEFAIVHKLRRVLSGLDSHQAIDLLISQLRKTKTNYEFLVQV
ncbi:transcription termination factor Rho, partial [Mycobacterium sp.]|uniref:transcription termination factor Rho n=1 Tax=Mycobacterium sp. TaxID=1785 RepID=UPI0039C91156